LSLTIHHSIRSFIVYEMTVILVAVASIATVTDEWLILIAWIPQLLHAIPLISLYHECMDFYHLYRSSMKRAAEKARRSQFHQFSALPFELKNRIIMMALEDNAPPRIININRGFAAVYQRHDAHTQLPTLLHVSSDARNEILRHYPGYFPTALPPSFIGPNQMNFPRTSWETQRYFGLNNISTLVPLRRRDRRSELAPTPTVQLPTYHPDRDIFFLEHNPLTMLLNAPKRRLRKLDIRVLALPDYSLCCCRRFIGMLLRTRLNVRKFVVVVGDAVEGRGCTRLAERKQLVPLQEGVQVVQVRCEKCEPANLGTFGEVREDEGELVHAGALSIHGREERDQFVTAATARRILQESFNGLKKMNGTEWRQYTGWCTRTGYLKGDWEVPTVEIMRWRGRGEA
jgi:hypothetical protein